MSISCSARTAPRKNRVFPHYTAVLMKQAIRVQPDMPFLLISRLSVLPQSQSIETPK